MNGLKPKPRPKVLCGATYKYSLGCGNIYITVNHNSEGRPIEVFASIGKSGVCSNMFSDSLTRTISLGLRAGVDMDKLIKQLELAACGQGAWNNGVFVNSCSDAIAKALKQAKMGNGEAVEERGEEEIQGELGRQQSSFREIQEGIETGGRCSAC